MNYNPNISNSLEYGLSKGEIAEIQRFFSDYTNIEKVILYGSRAMGTHRPASDVDLTIIGKQITLSQVSEIEQKWYDSSLPYKLDLSIMSQIENQDLLEHIKSEGKVFFTKSS
jgi:predicted nucleotidyltransferase